MTTLNSKRTVAELKELRTLTADENGAQRVAFTKTWLAARNWLREKLKDLPIEIHNDAAGNTWFTLPGASDKCSAQWRLARRVPKRSRRSRNPAPHPCPI